MWGVSCSLLPITQPVNSTPNQRLMNLGRRGRTGGQGAEHETGCGSGAVRPGRQREDRDAAAGVNESVGGVHPRFIQS